MCGIGRCAAMGGSGIARPVLGVGASRLLLPSAIAADARWPQVSGAVMRAGLATRVPISGRAGGLAPNHVPASRFAHCSQSVDDDRALLFGPRVCLLWPPYHTSRPLVEHDHPGAQRAMERCLSSLVLVLGPGPTSSRSTGLAHPRGQRPATRRPTTDSTCPDAIAFSREQTILIGMLPGYTVHICARPHIFLSNSTIIPSIL